MKKSSYKLKKSENGRNSRLTMQVLFAISGVLLMGSGVLGCRTFELKPPEGFVRYKRTSKYYRAVSPDNAAIVVRSWKNKQKGDLGFWVETVKRDFIKVRGYKFVKDDDAKAGTGEKGKRMWFESSHRGRMFSYQISLFVTKDKIYAVEASVEKENLERHEKAFDAAVQKLKIL